LSVQLLIFAVRKYSFVGELAWFVGEQSHVYVGNQILLVKRKVSHMPSMSLVCGFARLLKKGAASKPENQSTQKSR